MATESPLRMPSHKEAANFAPSTPNMAVEDLGLLRKGQRFRGNGRDAVPDRSGSAPPSMEGSFLAINNLISQQNSSRNSSLGSLNNAVQNFDSDKLSYLAYYGSNVNQNPRLPTPPIPKENRHLGHHTGRFGNSWGLTSKDDSSTNSLHLRQATLSTHKEESEDDPSPRKPSDELVDRTNGFWSGEDAVSSVGQSKSLVDILQVAILLAILFIEMCLLDIILYNHRFLVGLKI